MPKKDIYYFEEPGEIHSDKTLELAKVRAEELGIKDIIVASTRGETGVKTVKLFKDHNVVVVPHVMGFREPGEHELTDENRKMIEKAGGKILVAAHAFSGVDQAIFSKWNTMYPAGIIAQTLRMFGQGMKVVVEIVAVAADAGLIPVDKDVVAIAGSHRGADTAVVIKPANSRGLFDIVVKEIIAKPSTL